MDIVRQEVVAGNRVDISEFGLFQALRHPEYILIEAEAAERYLMPPSVEVVFEAAITASDSEMPEVGGALYFIPDASFEEEANSPFALFEPTMVNEGVHFPGLLEVVVNEPKATEEESNIKIDTGTEKPTTLVEPELPETPETPEVPKSHEILVSPVTPVTLEPLITSEVPEAPSTPSTPKTLSTSEIPVVSEEREASVPRHQQKRPPIWIPILGGAVVALVAFLFSRQRGLEE